jgi:hypothetical protein
MAHAEIKHFRVALLEIPAVGKAREGINAGELNNFLMGFFQFPVFFGKLPA